MEAQIVDSETSKKITVYKICVNSGSQSWFILRRYKEFNTLYDKLKKMFPDAGLKLPGKRLFGNQDPDFIKQRREGLDHMVQVLLNHKQIRELPEVIAFLGLNLHNDPPEEAELAESLNSPAAVKEGEDEVPELGKKESKKARPSDFIFLKVIGKGSFGKVFLAKRKEDGRVFAVKVLQKEHIKKRNEVKHIMSERNVLVRNVEHPFLTHLHMSFRSPDKLYFVLDYVNGGELFFHLQRERCFPEARAKFYAAEMASAVGYLHSMNIIYRDLKPENILLDHEGHVKLTDFGLCKDGLTIKGTTSTFCGTPEYLAPEVLRKQPYDFAVDWWCLGSVLYEMLFGLPPFYSRDTSEMYDNILHRPLRLKPTASVQAQEILTGLLQKDKRVRLGSRADYEEVKSQDFFAVIDFDALLRKEIPVPFKPAVSSPMSTENIDADFTREAIPKSVDRFCASVQEADNDFNGFSYVPAALDAFD